MKLVRNFLAASLIAGVVVASPHAASRFDQAPGASIGQASPPVPASNPVLADTDGDGMADGLATILAGKGASETVDIVVVMDSFGSVGKAQGAVGGFKIRHDLSLINGFSATVTAGQAHALSKLPFVERIEPVYGVSATLEGARSDTGVAPLRAALSAGSAYGRGAGVTICVVDSGVQFDHELFVGLESGLSKITRGYYAVNGDIVGDTTDMALLRDNNGHGTHVATIAAGDGDGDALGGESFAAPLMGMAPDAGILPAKVLDAYANGLDEDVLGAVQWCAQQSEVRVINLSINGDAVQSDGLDAMSLMVNAAVQAGKVVIAGAGNSDSPNDIHPPASAHLAVSVGAYGEWTRNTELEAAADDINIVQGDEVRASYSKGPYTTFFSTRGVTSDGRIVPDLVAPGMSVIAGSSNWIPEQVFDCGTGCYETKYGTSMAAPMVSGISALVIAANPGLTPDQVRQILFNSAEHRGPADASGNPLKSRHWGYGMVDAYAAVSLAREMADPSDPSLGASKTQFPSGYEYGEGTVGKSQSAWIDFTVNDTSAPLTIMVTAPEDSIVHSELFFDWEKFAQVWIHEVRPDLDAFLYKVEKGNRLTLLTSSECPGGLTEYCNNDIQYGLQETIAIAPEDLATGRYRLEIRFLDVPGTPAEMTEATYTYQISQGPLADASGIEVVNLPPLADAGGDYATSSTLVTLDGDASSDDGTIKLYAWQWSINGGANDGESGSSSAITSTLALTVGDGGTLYAKLTVVDNLGASASDEVVVIVDTTRPDDVAPVAAFVPNCMNLICDFTDGSTHENGTITSWLWTFGDGNASIAQHPNHTYVADGDYTVTLTVTDNNGLSDQLSKSVTITSPSGSNVPPTADAGGPYAAPADGKGKTASAVVTLTGIGEDANSDSLNMFWTRKGQTESLVGTIVVDPVTGGYKIDVDTPPLLKGTHYFTLSVSDGTTTVTSDACVEVYGGKNPSGTCGGTSEPTGDTGTVKGTVKRGKTKLPDVLAIVASGGVSTEVTTGSRGQYSTSGVLSGAVTVTAFCDADTPVNDTAPLDAGGTVTVNLNCP